MDRTKKRFAYISLVLVFAMMFSAAAGYFVGTSLSSNVAYAAKEDYYASLDTSATGATFRSQLASLIKSTHSYNPTYAGLKTIYPTSDADPNNSGKILWFYTGTSVSFSGFGSGAGTTNREHVWPKQGGAAFPETSGPGSDAHHLRPAEAQLNSTRSNNSFGEVSQTVGNIVAENKKTDYDNLCYLSGNLFYPGVGYRGATARILMYMQVRWGDEYDLRFVDSAGHSKTIGKISDLMKWHLQEPPTQEEITRNEVVYGIQGNRNPFIDHPEYAAKIFCYDGKDYNSTLLDIVEKYNTYGDSGNNNSVKQITLSPSTLTLTKNQTSKISATFSPIGATTTLSWSSSDTSVATVDQQGNVTAKASGSATITAVSNGDSSVFAKATITVKEASSIAISGTLSKTSYIEGDTFDPTGLTVTVTYSDGSSAVVSNSSCKWFDSTTRANTLSAGTTSVLCIVDSVEKEVSGITVAQSSAKSIVITSSSFSGSGAYNWTSWSVGEISGYGYMYPGNKTQIQMNSSKPSYHIYNTTPLPGKINTITIVLKDGSQNTFEIRTSPTAFSQTAKYPTTGTSQGSKTATDTGVSWTINGDDRYFTINYTGSGAVYIESITITYGAAICDHDYSDWIDEVPATYTSDGIKGHYTCSLCGKNFDENLDEIADLTIPMLEAPAPCEHNFGEWIDEVPATYTSNGVKGHYTCSLCGKYFDESHNEIADLTIPKLEGSDPCEHNFGEWIAEVPATYTSNGVKGHYTCSLCGKHYDENHIELTSLVINKLVANTSLFEQSVAQVLSSQTHEQQYTAIVNALNEYNKLDDEVKALIEDEYLQLLFAIDDYNAYSQSINKEMNDAVEIALFSTTGLAGVLLALLLALKSLL